MPDPIRDIAYESPLFCSIVELGVKQAIEESIKWGIEQGKLAEARQLVIDFVRVRFPELESFANQCVHQIDNTQHLHHLAIEMSLMKDADQAMRILKEMGTGA